MCSYLGFSYDLDIVTGCHHSHLFYSTEGFSVLKKEQGLEFLRYLHARDVSAK